MEAVVVFLVLVVVAVVVFLVVVFLVLVVVAVFSQKTVQAQRRITTASTAVCRYRFHLLKSHE